MPVSGAGKKTVCGRPYLEDMPRIAARRRPTLRLLQASPPATPGVVIATCALCHGPIYAGLKAPNPGSYSIDHRWPKALGGGEAPANLQPAHLGCNQHKGATPPRGLAEAARLAELSARGRPSRPGGRRAAAGTPLTRAGAAGALLRLLDS